MQQSFASGSAVAESCDLNRLIGDALRFAKVDESRGIEVQCDYAELPEVETVRGKLLQVLVSLLKNAADAVGEEGVDHRLILIRTGFDGQRTVRLEVEDSGVGIPPEDLTKIFSHGFTTKEGRQGFGLHGAALSVKEMGGKLTVHSDGPGLGAVFTVELPAREPAPAEPAEDAASPAAEAVGVPA